MDNGDAVYDWDEGSYYKNEPHPVTGLNYGSAEEYVQYLNSQGIGGVRVDTGPIQFIKIDHGGGYTTEYWHVRAIDGLEVGTYVDERTLIGFYDISGKTTGPHVHFVMKVNGRPVDPRPFLRPFKP